MKQIIDNFSATAGNYATYRPQSPDAIYEFLYKYVKRFSTAWDCGTGNGQVAVKLAERFETVYGTDISAEQLLRAQHKSNITYRKERAEATTIKDASVDLVTVGQAIHWFDFDAFYKEVRRVAAPGALVAAWTYTNLQVTPAVNEVLDNLYMDITRPYWNAERKWVDECYATIPFPFREIVAPPISISVRWNIAQVLGYLHTWSGVQNYMREKGSDPIVLITGALRREWGNEEFMEVRFPVYVRSGYVD